MHFNLVQISWRYTAGYCFCSSFDDWDVGYYHRGCYWARQLVIPSNVILARLLGKYEFCFVVIVLWFNCQIVYFMNWSCGKYSMKLLLTFLRQIWSRHIGSICNINASQFGEYRLCSHYGVLHYHKQLGFQIQSL